MTRRPGRRARAAACGVLALTLTGVATTSAVAQFAPEPIPLAAKGLVDVGVVDFDRDGDLDAFTTNHSFRQVLLANDGSGGLTDVLYDLGLEQEPRFPGVENMFARPTFDEARVYVYFDAGLRLHVRATTGGGPARGEITFLAPVAVAHAAGVEAQVRTNRDVAPPTTTVRYRAADAFHLVLDPRGLAIPIRFRFDEVVDPATVRVGPREVAPDDRAFAIFLRDRHGIAWADLAGDAGRDAFVVRGGLKGAILDPGYRRLLRDELMVAGSTRFADHTLESDLAKGTCRGRAAGAVDFNGDGRLDLFASCVDTPPRLYRQNADGTFASASRGLREAGVAGSAFRFFDLDGRGPLELLAAGRDRFVAYRFAGAGQWVRVDGASGEHNGQVHALAVGDYDGDRDADVFAAAPSGATLLVNSGGALRAQDPGSLGLPASGLAATWTDFDADGRPDLHVVPGGLFRSLPGGAFAARPGPPTAPALQEARVAWPDIDGDGDRDAIVATVGRGRTWDTALHENEVAQGRWLQVELRGPAGNREAVGARVTVRTAAITETAWVGQSDSSRYSQGHYRLYFGLGDAAGVQNVRIRWPDGTLQDLGALATDQHLTVTQP